MKKILLLCLVMLMVPAVYGQVSFGVRAGIGSSALVQKVDGSPVSGARFGFSVAGLLDVPVYKRFSLRPELVFINQGGSYEAFENSTTPTAHSCYYYSIQVPLNVVYSIPINEAKLGISLGPNFNYSLFGNMKSGQADYDIKFGQTEENDLKPFDLGVNVGLSAIYKDVFFGIHATCGTLDRLAEKPQGASSVYQNNITFSLGYFFR